MTFVFQILNKCLALNPMQQVFTKQPNTQLKTELQGSSFRFISAVENEFKAFNLQLKARPRKLHLNNISFKNSSFHYNAKESTKKPKQVSASEREQAKRKCVLRLLL